MSIKTEAELLGMQMVSRAVALTLKAMREHTKPGMSTGEIDAFGAVMLESFGARSAPILIYKFPGHTCISVNNEVAHGIPSDDRILQEGDLVNIDVSAELNGFFADNGGSFVLGEDIHGHQTLVDASKDILRGAIDQLHSGMRISLIGRYIQTEAKKRGYRVIKNLAGHGVGRSLHEEPMEILNCYDAFQRGKLRENSVIALETFISTDSSVAHECGDGWTLKGNKGGYVAQHEHTLLVQKDSALILTADNAILN